jgi:tRNA pseudouridine(55) synthase
MPIQRRDIDGIILLDKPLGLSSNQALGRVKYLLAARKAGHTGSLDPLATGLLPLCFGQATKVSGWLLDADKRYVAVARLGVETATGDLEGEVLHEAPVPVLSDAEIEAACAGLRGTITQVPPMYSALKHDGQRLYDLARQGIEVERPARTVTIHSLEITRVGPTGCVSRPLQQGHLYPDPGPGSGPGAGLRGHGGGTAPYRSRRLRRRGHGQHGHAGGGRRRGRAPGAGDLVAAGRPGAGRPARAPARCGQRAFPVPGAAGVRSRASAMTGHCASMVPAASSSGSANCWTTGGWRRAACFCPRIPVNPWPLRATIPRLRQYPWR